MGRRKKYRYACNEENPFLVEAGKEIYEKIKGKRHTDFFKNTNPITLELACGRGEYSTGFGPQFPERNFIGVDIRGDRIFHGLQKVDEQKLTNVGFLRAQIVHLDKYIAENEIAEIRVVQPDPRPRDGDEKRRLTSKRFLELYKKILQPGGVFHLKTDHSGFFEYSLESLQANGFEILDQTTNLHATPDLLAQQYGVVTRYEQMAIDQGETIKYLRARVK
ncbi:MAG: tRNA (guanosine(46)-N7)-methyltransferase TrmB [candidate division SR1 bacterium]|nr:MAG: tRNA (guanosine(46)-N7)-methyltransferase TrmB [candidate division SR1 bacterium]